jgi:propionyl-CoA carboxylase alpha chain
MFYDPMIAKLVTHAPTRLEAIDMQAEALDAFYIEGIQHNIPFLTALMQHPRWREGRLSTGFIQEEYPDGFVPRTATGADLETLAMVAAAIDSLQNARRRRISQQINGSAVRFAAKRVVVINGAEVPLTVAQTSDHAFNITPEAGDGADVPIEVASYWWPGQPVWTGRVGGHDVSVQVKPLLNGVELAWRGIRAQAYVYTEREAALFALMPEKIAADTSKLLLCPMPGLVKAIHATAGQDVKAGDALAVVEAMKMENVLRAERDGVVKSVNAKAGDSLAVDAVIMEFA